MTQSIRWRLAIAATLSIIAALTLAGFFLLVLFERHVARRVDHELSAYTKQLAASLTFDSGGRAELATDLADPRFQQPFSGLYWQIAEAGKSVFASRSLWNHTLATKAVVTAGSEPAAEPSTGPDGETLVVFHRPIVLEANGRDRAMVLTAALNRSEIIGARNAFLRELAFALGALAAVLIAAAWLQIIVGLRPLNLIRRRINTIRQGEDTRLSGDFPSEVAPLVTELNALLDAQEQAVTRARYSAADLAHGLKTPLAVLQAEGRALREQDMTAPADEIEQQVEQMRRRVERHLAIARLRGPSGSITSRVELAETVSGLVKAMRHMPRGDQLMWTVAIPDSADCAMDREDFLEAFGNILDNARKWAGREVIIDAEQGDGRVAIAITDDGPGVPEADREQVFERGRRLDTQHQGSGLGLAIAREIITAYGGQLSLDNQDGGGLKVVVALPAS